MNEIYKCKMSQVQILLIEINKFSEEHPEESKLKYALVNKMYPRAQKVYDPFNEDSKKELEEIEDIKELNCAVKRADPLDDKSPLIQIKVDGQCVYTPEGKVKANKEIREVREAGGKRREAILELDVEIEPYYTDLSEKALGYVLPQNYIDAFEGFIYPVGVETHGVESLGSAPFENKNGQKKKLEIAK